MVSKGAEGALKADIVAELLDVCTIGLVAVGAFTDRIGWEIRENIPWLRRILIAYDADWKVNIKVYQQLQRLTYALSRAGLAARVLSWPIKQGKGIDDYLINGGVIGWL